MTLSCVRVFVDGLAHLMWFLLQGLSQTVLHTFLTLDAQLHSITLSSPYVSTNRRPKAQKRGAAVDRRRRLQLLYYDAHLRPKTLQDRLKTAPDPLLTPTWAQLGPVLDPLRAPKPLKTLGFCMFLLLPRFRS